MRKHLVFAIFPVLTSQMVHADVSIASSSVVTASPDTAFVSVFFSHSEVDPTKLNRKLDEKIQAFTSKLTDIKGMRQFVVKRVRIGPDQRNMYGDRSDAPTILKGTYEIRVEFEPKEQPIWEFVRFAIDSDASLFDQYGFNQDGIIVYGLKDAEDAESEGFNQALALARKRATAIARDSGLTLGHVTNVRDLSSAAECYQDYGSGRYCSVRYRGSNPEEIKIRSQFEFTFETD